MCSDSCDRDARLLNPAPMALASFMAEQPRQPANPRNSTNTLIFNREM